MSAQHTPGPWFAFRNSAFWEVRPDYQGEYPRPENIPYCVADCCASNPAQPDGGLQEANARLIAAAPELLAALRDLLASNGDAETWEPAIAAARAAIAKAGAQQ